MRFARGAPLRWLLAAALLPAAAPDDALCAAGIVSEPAERRVCCAGSCGVCGGPGCHRHGRGARQCCKKTIYQAGSACQRPADVGCVLPSGANVSQHPVIPRFSDARVAAAVAAAAGGKRHGAARLEDPERPRLLEPCTTFGSGCPAPTPSTAANTILVFATPGLGSEANASAANAAMARRLQHVLSTSPFEVLVEVGTDERGSELRHAPRSAAAAELLDRAPRPAARLMRGPPLLGAIEWLLGSSSHQFMW